MPAQRFLQIHTLTSYPAVLLNRDDAGFAKRLPYGGVSRTRVSSQCLKHHWRMADDEHALSRLGVEMTLRSREIFRREILPALRQDGVEPDLAEAAVAGLMEAVLQESDRSKAARREGTQALATDQVVLLGRPEIRFLIDAARRIAGVATDPAKVGPEVKAFIAGQKDNLRALVHGAGLDAALFGRMVTSDILARKDAAVHVAHAFTVHGEESESDFFAVVDDLATTAAPGGSGHLGAVELNSGTFYGYVVVDLPLLTSNLTGCERRSWHDADRSLTARVVESLLHLVAKVSPGAKRGSTAPYGYAELVLLELGDRQPRSLAGAFHTPVRAAAGRSMLAGAAEAMARRLDGVDAMYGRTETRWLACVEPPATTPPATLPAATKPAISLPAADRHPFDAMVAAVVAAVRG